MLIMELVNKPVCWTDADVANVAFLADVADVPNVADLADLPM